MCIRTFAVAGVARLICAALAIFAFSAAAEAAGFLTFVSATGNDTAPCTSQAAPCKTLQRAVNVTSAGGEIRLLTSLSGGATITKSLTIAGHDNAVIGTITINGASAVVILRGMALNGGGAAAHGIVITSAAAVHIEDCTVERYTNDGISFVTSAPTKLFVSGTVSRANGSDGLYANSINAQAVIENSNFEQNVSTGVYLRVGKASVTRSAASGNAQNGFILSAANRLRVSETVADNNAVDGFSVRGFAYLSSAEAGNNGFYDLHMEPGAVSFLSDCLFDRVLNHGAVFSRLNNTVSGSTGNIPLHISPY